MPTLIEVWDSRLGITEVSGKGNNATILQWCRDAGHPEIITDSTAWCSTSMCSACKEAGLPFPPVNANPMARSWLTMGKGVSIDEAAEGDIVVWPRNGLNSIYGHVNMIRHIKRDADGRTLVRCIGGNQTKAGTEGAVTLTNWTDLAGALPNGIRRMVPATVPALRAAGSSTIKAADRKEKAAILMVFATPVLKGVEYLTGIFGPVDVPTFASLPEGLSWWQAVLGGANVIAGYVVAHPYLALTLVGGLALWGFSRMEKSGRVAEHQAGIPIAGEVAKMEAA
jgi:uncharacterized protein (TIGR02594 family)